MANGHKPFASAVEIDRRQLFGGAALATFAAGCATAAPVDGPAAGAASLEDAFRSPPRDARPGVFWHWISGQVTREGITKDLEAMARAGFGRAVLFSVSLAVPPVPGLKQYRSLTPEWWEMVEHAISEASRLDVDIAIAVGDGWATAGGPWITPDLSMQRLTHSLTRVRGTGTPIVLDRPPAIENHYRDICVVGFPIPASWETSVTRTASVTSSFSVPGADRLNTFDNRQTIVDADKPGWIQFTFDRPFTVRSVTAQGPAGVAAGPGMALQASDDGMTFRTIGQLAQPRLAEVSELGDKEPAWPMIDTTWSIDTAPATTAQHFRLAYSPDPGAKGPAAIGFDGLKGDPDVPAPAKRLQLARLVLNDVPVIPKINERNAQAWALPLEQLDASILPDAACVKRADIVDLTDKMDANGALAWVPPDQRVWQVMRIGHTSTGAINGTGHPAGRGLESDKLRLEATRIQFDGWVGELARRVDKQGKGRALDWMLMDSWEAGSQNWSPALADAFRAKRGYDILAFAPLLVGVPVESADVCERVLTDLRRTIAELVQENFFGEMKRLGDLAGYRFAAESANPVFPVDGLAAARHVDEPMGEFWLKGDDKPSDIAEAVHSAHIYGRTLIGAEAFTEFGMDWRETPYVCKPSGDANWAKGINRLSCHVWAAQPWTDEAHEPGMTLADIGVSFGRTNTWFEMAKPWFDYMRRGHALLQQGRPVADICCWIGENIPARAYLPSNAPLPIPEGYSFDSINSDVLLRLARVENGDIVLPQGQRYRVLVLPQTRAISPAMLRRLGELVEAGATVVGHPYDRSISFENYETADDEVQRLVQRLWAPASSPSEIRARKVIATAALDSVLTSLGAAPDVTIQESGRKPGAASQIMWTHRAGADWDLYFFSNQAPETKTLDVALRVVGREPEVWDANTGEMRRVALWRQSAAHTHLPLTLEPYGSTFIVLRRPTTGPLLAAISDAGLSASVDTQGRIVIETSTPGVIQLAAVRGGSRAAPVPNLPEAVTLTGPWAVTFTKGLPTARHIDFARLQSWTESSDPDIRHYAGVAAYEIDVPIDRGLLRPDLKWILDLGVVAELCEVTINGRSFAALWKPPFELDVTRALVGGRNRVRVDVVNTWRNRLIADAALPVGERRSFLTLPFFRGTEAVGPSNRGAFGPVYDDAGLFLGGGYGNDARSIPARGSPAGTPPPQRIGESRYGFAGGGSSAPTSAVFRPADDDGLVASGLLGPVMLRPRAIVTVAI
jgi:hypothetical protein